MIDNRKTSSQRVDLYILYERNRYTLTPREFYEPIQRDCAPFSSHFIFLLSLYTSAGFESISVAIQCASGEDLSAITSQLYYNCLALKVALILSSFQCCGQLKITLRLNFITQAKYRRWWWIFCHLLANPISCEKNSLIILSAHKLAKFYFQYRA